MFDMTYSFSEIAAAMTEGLTYEELYDAYLCCMKRKSGTENARRFAFDESENLYALYTELKTMVYEVGPSIAFCVTKPVKREVFAADFRDRIIHHLIMNRLERLFEGQFITDSYSCRKGKGTLFGIRRLREKLIEATDNYEKEAYIIKCDLKSYFMTIVKRAVFDKLRLFMEGHGVSDLEFMEWLVGKVIFDRPQDHCIRKQPASFWDDLPKDKSLFGSDGTRGLPIGNLTSQWFANFFLDDFDHWVTDVLGYRYYGRYVDDFYIIVPVEEGAECGPSRIVDALRERLAKEGVTLHPKKLYIQKAERGVLFIGSMVKRGRMYIGNRTKGNMYQRLKCIADGFKRKMDGNGLPTREEVDRMISVVNSYLGLMRHFRTYNIKKRLFGRPFMRYILMFCDCTEGYGKVVRKKDVYASLECGGEGFLFNDEPLV